jgi:hypothetical protein
MSGKNLNYIYGCYVLVSILSIIGVFSGKLSFGLGLGDLGIIIITIIVLILGGFLVYFKTNISTFISQWNLIASILLLLFIIYLVLSLTVLRGVENPWKGNVFIN